MITVEVNKREEEKPKDIFCEGNLVTTEEGLIIIVSDGEGNYGSDSFKGQVLFDQSNARDTGRYSDGWIKNKFTQFTGTITITSK